MQKPLTLTLDMNVLNHLGIGLYLSAPAVLTELVANAWDADAKEVAIDLDLGAKRIGRLAVRSELSGRAASP